MNQTTTQQFDYTELREWLSFHRLYWSDLAREAGVSSAAVSYYVRLKQHFPLKWILCWQKTYGWSRDELMRLCIDNRGGIKHDNYAKKERLRRMQARSTTTWLCHKDTSSISKNNRLSNAPSKEA